MPSSGRGSSRLVRILGRRPVGGDRPPLRLREDRHMRLVGLADRGLCFEERDQVVAERPGYK